MDGQVVRKKGTGSIRPLDLRINRCRMRSESRVLSQDLRFVGLLPGEFRFIAAEMAVRGSLLKIGRRSLRCSMMPRGVIGKCLRTSLSRLSTETFSVFLVSTRRRLDRPPQSRRPVVLRTCPPGRRRRCFSQCNGPCTTQNGPPLWDPCRRTRRRHGCHGHHRYRR